MARKLEEIKKQLAGLAHKVDVDPVFSNNTSKDDSGSDGGVSGGSATETVADPTTLTMPVSDDTVHDYLNNKKVSVILQPSSNASDNVLTVDSGLTVPSGKSLTVGNGISADVQNGQTLQVNGHMEMEGSLTNAGTVNNTSANTLQIGGDLDNAGTLENRTGRLIVNGAFLNRGTLSTGNTVENSSAVQNTGTFTVTGGTAGAIDVNRGGTLNVNSGTISDVVENGGTLQLNGGTIGNLTISSKEIDISRGNVETVKVNGGGLIVDGGTTNEVNMPGNGKIILKSGNGGDLTIVQGTVDVQAGATLKHVDVQGGTFELNGGVISNGIVQSGPANVVLNSGEVKTDDELYSAIQIDDGNMILNLDNVKVSSDLPGSLLQINNEGKIQPESKSFKETILRGKESIVSCEAEKKLAYNANDHVFRKMEGPYTLKGILPDLVAGLTQGKNREEFIFVLSDDVTLNYEEGYKTGNGSYIIELNGKTLNVNSRFTIGNNGDGSPGSTYFVIRDETGKGILQLNDWMVFNEYIEAMLQNLNLELGKNGVLKTGSEGCAFLSMNHVTVTEAASAEDSTDAFIEAENIGYLNIDNVVAESMSRHFCMGISAVNIQDSTLMSKDSCIFWISDAGIKKASISYHGNVLLSVDNGPFYWPRTATKEDLQRILPSYEQCSADMNEGIAIRMKNYVPGFTNMLQMAGYKLDPDPGEDTSAVYRYIMPENATTLALLDVLATPSDMIPIEDMPLATDSDADSIANEIIDEDEDYEKSTPSNADDFIRDEDEPYQDSDDDEDDDEPRNIPIEPVLSAIPSTSTKDTTQPEEDPDSKKDENPDANNPEQEENQNGEPDSDPEEEPEPEKEQADLLHTEPSNVPDPREEEES